MTKLLIIEDDLLLDEAYSRKFSDKNDVRIAVDGESGIKTALVWKPDVILLDIYMPGKMNGLDVLKALKGDVATHGIPVLVITNLPDAMDKVMEMGATKCYMKTDVDLNKINEEIEAIVASK